MKKIKLQTDTLSNQFKKNNITEIDFIKIDTQGYALTVLNGSINHLEKTIGLEIEVEFIEIYQNCNIFNDGAFSDLTEKETKEETQLILEHEKPMIFGVDQKKGLILEGATFKVVKIGKNYNADDVIKHNMYDKNLAMLLSEITYIPELPVPIGILYKENKPTYEQMMTEQIQEAIDLRGKGDLEKLITGTNSWIVE